MFIVFGDKNRTEPCPDGICRVMTCPKCGAHTTFREHVISKQFRLYFVDMFTHDSHHVLACDACATMFVTDELKSRKADDDHRGTVYGALQGAAKKTKQVAAKARSADLGKTIEQAGTSVGKAVETTRRRVDGLLGRLRDRSKK